MNRYKELLAECYSCICQSNVRDTENFIDSLESILYNCPKSELTKTQIRYIIGKAESYIHYHYENLADFNYYSSLNNNEKSDPVTIRRVCMYLRNMNPNYDKGRLYKSVFNAVKHNKNKYSQNLYNRLIKDIYFSIFISSRGGLL